MAEMQNPGRIGDVRLKTGIKPSDARDMMSELVKPPPMRHNRRRKKGIGGKAGKFEKVRGAKPRAILKASVFSTAKWNFQAVNGLFPISRDGLLEAASFRTYVEDSIRMLYAGTKPGIVTWARAEASLLRYLFYVFCRERLIGMKKIEDPVAILVFEKMCKAMESCSDILESIGLARLSEMPEEVDAWDVEPMPPEQLPADVISPRDPSAREIVEEFEPKGDANDTCPDSDEGRAV